MVEATDNRDAPGAGRPDREARAGLPADLGGVCAQLLVQIEVLALGEQVQIVPCQPAIARESSLRGPTTIRGGGTFGPGFCSTIGQYSYPLRRRVDDAGKPGAFRRGGQVVGFPDG